MLSTPEIVSRPDQSFAAIRISLDRSEIPSKAPPLIGEVAGWLAAKGAGPVGAPFFSYLEMPEDGPMVMEVGFPTAKLLAGDSRVRTGTIPAGRFATLIHTGPYDGLYQANVALGEWLGKVGSPIRCRKTPPANTTRPCWRSTPPTRQPNPTRRSGKPKWRSGWGSRACFAGGLATGGVPVCRWQAAGNPRVLGSS
jgi:effector-binding domain-containing protein